MSTRWARFARGWLVAVFSTATAAASHTMAGGTAPGPVALLVAMAFAGVTCIALTGARVSLIRVASSVALSQVAFHALFASLASGARITVTGATAHHRPTTMFSPADVASAAQHHDGLSMWAGHAVAAVATILALRFGESAFWRLGSVARLFFVTAFAVAHSVAVLPRGIRRPVATDRPRRPRPSADVRLSRGLRGPPALSAA
jgi:hypothetical protein